MSTIALQRSLTKARAEGYDVWVVERFIPSKPFGHRLDLYNLIDILGMRCDVPGLLGIQACPSGEISAHIKKIRNGYFDKKGVFVPPNPHLALWKKTGNRFVIWGWSKRGARGKRKLWECKKIEL